MKRVVLIAFPVKVDTDAVENADEAVNVLNAAVTGIKDAISKAHPGIEIGDFANAARWKEVA